MQRPTVAILYLLVATAYETAYAIRCYESRCLPILNGHENCKFDDGRTNLVECRNINFLETIQKLNNGNLPTLYHLENLQHHKLMTCAKVTGKVISNNEEFQVIHRACVPSGEDSCNDIRSLIPKKYDSAVGSYVRFPSNCSLCATDACNGAYYLQLNSTFLLVILTIVVLIQLEMCFY